MERFFKEVTELTTRYSALAEQAETVQAAAELVINCYKNGGKVLICGNGGSAADSTHIVGELMKGFLKKRPVEGALKQQLQAKNPELSDSFFEKLQVGLPAVNLCESAALLTAFCNDVDPAFIFAQQAFGLGKPGDVLIGISTSGNAENVNNAVSIAKAAGLKTVGLTGAKGGRLLQNADLCIRVPETETFKVQELHLPVYHCICAAAEAAFFEK